MRRWVGAAPVLLFTALGLGVGALAGVLWQAVVVLPTYTIGSQGGASTTERGLASYISGDAWFVVCALVAGIVLGVLGWRLFGRTGWLVVPLVVLVTLAAGLVCWTVGQHLGPGPFEARLSSAGPGDVVPIELTVRARAALVTWPLFGIIPVLLAASLGRDEEEPAKA